MFCSVCLQSQEALCSVVCLPLQEALCTVVCLPLQEALCSVVSVFNHKRLYVL